MSKVMTNQWKRIDSLWKLYESELVIVSKPWKMMLIVRTADVSFLFVYHESGLSIHVANFGLTKKPTLFTAWKREVPKQLISSLAYRIGVPMVWNVCRCFYSGICHRHDFMDGIGFTRFLLYTSNKTRPLKVSNAKRGHCSSHPCPVGETLIRWNEWRSRKNFFLDVLTFYCFLKHTSCSSSNSSTAGMLLNWN